MCSTHFLARTAFSLRFDQSLRVIGTGSARQGKLSLFASATLALPPAWEGGERGPQEYVASYQSRSRQQPARNQGIDREQANLAADQVGDARLGYREEFRCFGLTKPLGLDVFTDRHHQGRPMLHVRSLSWAVFNCIPNTRKRFVSHRFSPATIRQIPAR